MHKNKLNTIKEKRDHPAKNKYIKLSWKLKTFMKVENFQFWKLKVKVESCKRKLQEKYSHKHESWKLQVASESCKLKVAILIFQFSTFSLQLATFNLQLSWKKYRQGLQKVFWYKKVLLVDASKKNKKYVPHKILHT